MLSKLRTLTVACSVAVLAVSAVSLACDKEKQIVAKSQCGSKQTAVVQVADASKQCSKSRQAAATAVAVSDKSAGCAKSAATQETMALLAKAVSAMDNGDARANVIAAYRTLAEANPKLTCEKQTETVKAIAIASGCCASKAKAKNTQVANKACDPSNCTPEQRAACAAALKASGKSACSSSKTRTTKVAGTSACSKSGQARYVAFGCEKTDTLARAAADNYLSIMSALKTYSGADGCSASCASKLLAQVLEDKSAQAAVVETEVETVANIETSVSLGAVSETKTKSQCSSKR